MLVEVLDKLFDLECNTFAGRIAIIISALYIGYLRADVTYHMKGDVALERCQELFKKTEEKQALRNGRNDIKILFSYADTWEKKQAILCYHLYPRLLKLAGIIIAAFTVYNYFGIALFSSGKGLIYILETLQKIIPSIPVPEQNDYGIWWYAAFGLISAIALAALNGLFNQGWDAYQRFKKWAKEEEKRLDAFIENRPYSSPKSEDWGIGYTLITATIFDSIFASLTAGTGVQLATEAGCSIHALAFLFCWQQFVIPLLVIFCIFWSQTNYALTLYKRDNTLWEKIFAKYTPTCLKEERDTCYPYTEGHPSAFDTTHSIFHRRDVETMTVSHEAAPSVGSVGSPPVISYNVGMR